MLDLRTKYTTGKCTKCRKRDCKSPENIVYNYSNGRVRSRHVSGGQSQAIRDLTVYGSSGRSGAKWVKINACSCNQLGNHGECSIDTK